MAINQERLLTEFTHLLSINSPSRKESDVSKIITDSLRQMGFSVTIDDAGTHLEGETGNIIASLPSTSPGGRNILLCAHMDTVTPTEGMTIIRDNGRVRQEGAGCLGADDKAGIAAILEGVRSVIEEGKPHGKIQVLILICEEIGLLGSKVLDMSLIDSELGFVFDSGQPCGHLVSSAPSHDNLIITFTGRPAHAGVCPEEGISAIRAASLAVSRMKLGRIDNETTANVGVISGGSARNIIPEKCEIKAEARSRDTTKLDTQTKHMTDECNRAAEETGCQVDIKISREYLGYQHRKDDPLMSFGLAAARSIGIEPDLIPHGGGSDCNILNAKGLPTAVVGVGYEKIHTPEEYITVDNLVRCTEYVQALVVLSADA